MGKALLTIEAVQIGIFLDLNGYRRTCIVEAIDYRFAPAGNPAGTINNSQLEADI
jgi:hypothetical protein